MIVVKEFAPRGELLKSLHGRVLIANALELLVAPMHGDVVRTRGERLRRERADERRASDWRTYHERLILLQIDADADDKSRVFLQNILSHLTPHPYQTGA